MAPTTIKHASLALALLASAASASSAAGVGFSPRQAGPTEEYINSVCRPQLSESADTTSAFVVPPCIAIETIEGLCKPNGTSPLALEAHAQCMCKGSFFSQWKGCQACQVFHGARSERDVAHFDLALGLASTALCGAGAGAKPTAAFQSLFESADYAAPSPSTGATTSKDAKPSDPAVSLYFTPTGSSWGPGAITGSATAATASGGDASPTPTASGTGGGSGSGSNTSSSTRGGSGSGSNSPQTSTTVSTTAAPGAAAPTAAAGVKGMLLAVAGGAMVAAL
ncbi:hypothetical protein Micbo1qcDRAFT_163505 [Microdochium bolleyi]|uniref:Extracellular membrane protein CFEM domain-containing protein n=1 Tax=Microdochium bolleyi TaxID=196109 RepID=A0A136J0V3_9PEZI|nr:hypothetical protein Micbo1qcDRAFT_163505 [Microdochium bolleyi]